MYIPQLNFKPDLVVSLGTNCRNAWNIRHRFDVQVAYPFDWWITPTRSMLRMIENDFQFDVAVEDLSIEEATERRNTVYNRRLHVLHQHDFPRNALGQVDCIELSQVDVLRAKYKTRFDRFFEAVHESEKPLFVVNGVAAMRQAYSKKCFDEKLTKPFKQSELIDAITDRVGSKAFTLILMTGPDLYEEHDRGLIVRLPDDGTLEPDAPAYAQPVNVYTRAFDALGL